jgi:hypothetical protein
MPAQMMGGRFRVSKSGEEAVLPKHGKMQCNECFSGGKNLVEQGKWRIRNDPGAWGAQEPKYLVLGFSKGSTQVDIYQHGDFDNVAFGGFETRRNLTNILRTVRLLSADEHVDAKIRASEAEFHFASLVRCSLARLNEKNLARTGERSYETSGELIVKSFTEVPRYLQTCATRHLKALPASVKLVAMLGTDDRYIKGVKGLIRAIHPSTFAEVNRIAFKAAGALWIHLTHPSRGNGNLSAWLRGDPANTSGAKRNLAEATIRSHDLCRDGS